MGWGMGDGERGGVGGRENVIRINAGSAEEERSGGHGGVPGDGLNFVESSEQIMTLHPRRARS